MAGAAVPGAALVVLGGGASRRDAASVGRLDVLGRSSPTCFVYTGMQP